MTDDSQASGPQTPFDQQFRAAFLIVCLCIGLCFGSFMAFFVGQAGWAGKGPAGEWAGPGNTGLVLGGLHGFAVAFGFPALLGLLVWTAKSRVKFGFVFFLAMVLLCLNSWFMGGLDNIAETALAIPKGMLLFIPNAFLVIAAPNRTPCPIRPRAKSLQLLVALAILIICVSETWLVYGWWSVLHALAIGVGLALLVGLPMVVFLQRVSPIEQVDEAPPESP